MHSLEENKFVLDSFYDIITPNKVKMFNQLAALRTRYLSAVLEDVFQDHNASAVIRSCDCLGIQDIHAIEERHKYVLQKQIALGAGRWVNLIRHNQSENSGADCRKALKDAGYALVVTSPKADQFTLETLPLDKPMALFFGTEQHGLSPESIQAADYAVHIPMYGFTESFNLSVSVALTMQNLRRRLEQSNHQWLLSESEQVALKVEWCVKILNGGAALENSYRKAFLEKN